MRLLDILKKLLKEDDSQAAQQAHQLGLQAVGWGYWADESGEPVARTIKGQLVRLTKDDEEPQPDASQAPAEGPPQPASQEAPAPQAPPPQEDDGEPDHSGDAPATDNIYGDEENDIDALDVFFGGRPRLPILDPKEIKVPKFPIDPTEPRTYPKSRMEEQMMIQKYKYDMAPVYKAFCEESFFDNPFSELSDAFFSALPNLKDSLEVAPLMLKLLNVRPDAHFRWDVDPNHTPGMPPTKGVMGAWNLIDSYICFDEETKRGLMDVKEYLTKENIASFVNNISPDQSHPNFGPTIRALKGVHVMIHELCHAKSRASAFDLNGGRGPDLGVNEGLTEYRARKLTASIVGPLNDATKQNIFNAYNFEVAAIEELIQADPTSGPKLWNNTEWGKRADICTDTLIKSLETKLANPNQVFHIIETFQNLGVAMEPFWLNGKWKKVLEIVGKHQYIGDVVAELETFIEEEVERQDRMLELMKQGGLPSE